MRLLRGCVRCDAFAVRKVMWEKSCEEPSTFNGRVPHHTRNTFQTPHRVPNKQKTFNLFSFSTHEKRRPSSLPSNGRVPHHTREKPCHGQKAAAFSHCQNRYVLPTFPKLPLPRPRRRHPCPGHATVTHAPTHIHTHTHTPLDAHPRIQGLKIGSKGYWAYVECLVV